MAKMKRSVESDATEQHKLPFQSLWGPRLPQSQYSSNLIVNKPAYCGGMPFPSSEFRIHHHNGHQILPLKPNLTPSPEPATSSVTLTVSMALPSRKGWVVQANVAIPDLDGEFLFKPNQETLDHGLTTLESVVTARGGEVLLPVDNYSERTLHIDAGEELGTLRSLP